MKDKSVFLKLLLIFGLLLISVVSVSAQDIDVDSMDNAQLMALLQTIMQKLEEQESGSGNQLSADSNQQAEENGRQEAGERIFSIYENKKLILERLPDWYFYQAPNAVEEDDDDNPPEKKKTKTPSECENYCAYEACDWGNLECYWDCYFPCIGEPYPQWHIDAKNP